MSIALDEDVGGHLTSVHAFRPALATGAGGGEATVMTASLRRGALAVAVSAFAIGVAAPSASASAGVCNQATPHWLGGGLVALDPPVNSPAARYTVDIGKLPANGAGLFTAAASSPSLTVCDGSGGDPVPTLTVVDDGGTTVAIDTDAVAAT
jgi:hypothetical protein